MAIKLFDHIIKEMIENYNITIYVFVFCYTPTNIRTLLMKFSEICNNLYAVIITEMNNTVLLIIMNKQTTQYFKSHVHYLKQFLLNLIF